MPIKVLVTEDSAVYQHLLVTQLSEWGLDVEAVRDAETALPAISDAQKPMLLLIDWELPGMNGIELLSKVRQLTVNTMSMQSFSRLVTIKATW